MAGPGTVPAPEKKGGNSVDKAAPTFTIDDLLAELRAADVPDGVTPRELCERAGLPTTRSNVAKAGRKVHDLVALDTWEFAGTRSQTTIAGYERPVWAYRPKAD